MRVVLFVRVFEWYADNNVLGNAAMGNCPKLYHATAFVCVWNVPICSAQELCLVCMVKNIKSA